MAPSTLKQRILTRVLNLPLVALALFSSLLLIFAAACIQPVDDSESQDATQTSENGKSLEEPRFFGETANIEPLARSRTSRNPYSNSNRD
ncbi:MAG: hypothetical protein O2854_04130 [Chloroflexi bacterium]|nr:hypothetical protein [Chloroflexota bacterium]